MFRDDLDGFNTSLARAKDDVRERFRCITREHCYHGVDDNFEFCLVCRSTFDEDIRSV